MEFATAATWYRTETAGDDITLVEEPHIVPFCRCNMWHVRGREHDMLVDSGMGVVPLREQVPLLTGRPCLAVASHTHFDHVGCHHEFDQRAVHPAEADILASPSRVNTVADGYVCDQIFTRLPPGWQAGEYCVKCAPATRLIDEGDIIDLGDRVFEVLHTPGHSPGGLMLFERASGVLFSGDTVYDGPLIDDCFHSDIASYVATMKRIHDLPVRVVHGGHFPSFDGARYRVLIRQYLEAKGA